MRTGAWLLALLLAACGSSGSTAPPASPFDFERSDYPQVVVLPLAAFREDRPTNGEADAAVQSALFERIDTQARTDQDTPFQADWDTMLGLLSNGMGDQRVATRYFLAYEVVHHPTNGTCSVTIHLIEGLPHDSTRPALAQFVGTAMLGENDRDGQLITVPGECAQEAAQRAFDLLHAAGHFDSGWSLGPPAHMP